MALSLQLSISDATTAQCSAPPSDPAKSAFFRRDMAAESYAGGRSCLFFLSALDYELAEAENGVEALAAIAKQKPDLILMDIQLPIMDGYETTRRIKAQPRMKDIPIIAVTSYALSGDEQKARDAQPPQVAGEDQAISALELLRRMSLKVARHVIRGTAKIRDAIGVTADIGRPKGSKGSVENDPELTQAGSKSRSALHSELPAPTRQCPRATRHDPTCLALPHVPKVERSRAMVSIRHQ